MGLLWDASEEFHNLSALPIAAGWWVGWLAPDFGRRRAFVVRPGAVEAAAVRVPSASEVEFCRRPDGLRKLGNPAQAGRMTRGRKPPHPPAGVLRNCGVIKH